jgi:prepilin-type N-terminal cleavage/methylation domain-containing protein
MKFFLKSGTKEKLSGFSLVELMVVIAIIGTLSAVVMTSLNSARGKAANTTIKSNLNTIRAQSLIFFDNNGFSYGATTNTCNALGRVFFYPPILQLIVANNAIQNGTYCAGTVSAWVVRSPLKEQEGSFTWWCVDHTGVSKGVTALQVTNWINTNYFCP